MMAKDGVTQLSETKFWAKLPSGTITDATLLTNEGKEAKEEFMKVFGVIKIYNDSTIPDNERVVYKGLNCTSCTTTAMPEQLYLNDGANIHLFLNKQPYTASCGDHKCQSLKEYQEYKQGPAKFWRHLGNLNIDVNGSQGPNTWGRDMFSFYVGDDGNLYPEFGVDFAMINKKACNYSDLSSCTRYWKYNTAKEYNCSTQTTSYGQSCAARIMEENWQMNY